MDLSVKSTTKRQIVDLGRQVEEKLDQSATGLVVVSVPHSTAAVTTANLDPGTDQDLLDALAAMIPSQKWRHPHDPSHAPDHLLASIVGPSVAVPVRAGKLALGVWQHLVLIELDGPREIKLNVTYLPIGDF